MEKVRPEPTGPNATDPSITTRLSAVGAWLTDDALREEASRRGFRLVHKDRIRTSYHRAVIGGLWAECAKVSEEELFRLAKREMREELAHFILKEATLDYKKEAVAEHFEPAHVFTHSLTIIGEKRTDE